MTLYYMTVSGRFFLSHDKTHTENGLFQREFQYYQKTVFHEVTPSYITRV